MRGTVVTNHLRHFGLIAGGIFGSIGLWPAVRRGADIRYWWVGLAVCLIVPALCFPQTLRLGYKVWIAMGKMLGREVNSKIRLRNVIVSIILYSIVFGLGVIWLQTKAFPYKYMSELDRLVFIKKKLVGSTPPVLPNIVESAFSGLKLERVKLDAEFLIQHNGGGIQAFGNKVIIVGKHGQFFLYQNIGGNKSVKKLDISTRNNYEEFLSFVNSKGLDDKLVRDWFRYNDILYHKDGTGQALLLSHHYWYPDRECFTVRISRLRFQSGEELELVSKSADDWATLYDSKPCLQLKNKGFYFAGHFAGGRMALLDEHNILFTVGFMGFDGWSSDHFYSQGTDGDYGKTLKIDLESGRASDFSIGHRNPQGLTIDRDGNIWSTEHGPRGGDELNLIEQGANYGWPYVTYGTQYGMTRWPLSATQGRHDGYKHPVFAWVPSIGVSNLIQIRGFLPEWDGDLLVASLIGQTLFRMHYREGRVIVVEPIRIGGLIRDLDQLENGNIVLWLGDTSIVEMTPVKTDAPAIETIVRGLNEPAREQATTAIQTCLQCHSASSDGGAKSTPSLWGIYGRKIASTAFSAYSPALRSKPGSWNAETLDAFLEDTTRFAPGTTMTYPGISSPTIRKVVIEYLKALKEE
jgi:cytochrome c2